MHAHPYQEEVISVKQGSLAYQVLAHGSEGKKQGVLQPGEQLVLAKGES